MSKRSRPPEEPRPCPEGTYDARLDAAVVVFGDLSYCETAAIGTLDESRPVGTALGGPLFGRGRLPDGSALELHAAVPQIPHRVVAGARSSLMADLFSVNGADRRTQEGSRTFVWGGRIPAEARIRAGGPVDLSTQVAADEILNVDFRIDMAPAGVVELRMISRDTTRVLVRVTAALADAAVGEWTSVALPLRCLVAAGLDPVRVTAPFVLASDGALGMTVSDVRLGTSPEAMPCRTLPAAAGTGR